MSEICTQSLFFILFLFLRQKKSEDFIHDSIKAPSGPLHRPVGWRHDIGYENNFDPLP